MSGLEVGLPETPLYHMPMSSPLKKCRHKGSKINVALSLRITPDLGMLERQNLYLTLPWISLHPKINILRTRRTSFIPQMTSIRGYSERSSKASLMGFLYTELSKKQSQSKDGQITLRNILDMHKKLHHWKAQLKGSLVREFRFAVIIRSEMSGLEVGLPETPLYYLPMSSPVRKCRHKGSEINFALSLGIIPDLGMLERHNLHLTLPWISLHPKIIFYGRAG